MYLTEEDLILLVIKALIKKKEAKSEDKSDCGCSIKKEMDEIRKADEKTFLLSPIKSKRAPDVSGIVADAPIFTSRTVTSSVLPASPSRILGVKETVVLPVLPPSPRNSSPRSLVTALPPSPKSSSSPRSSSSPKSSSSPRSLVTALPPSPKSIRTLPPSPRNSPVRSESKIVLPPSPRVSELSSLSYNSKTLPPIQKSPVVTKTSLPTLSKLTQLK
jgi:hypothetical protein